MATILKKTRARWTKEASAGGAITPGHLLQRSSTTDVVVHATAGGDAFGRFVALEDQASGKGIADAYAASDTVIYQPMLPGEEVLAIASAAIVANAFVESAGDGRVRTLAVGVEIGIAREAAGAADDRITIEIV